jgi:type 1 fimbria pilin
MRRIVAVLASSVLLCMAAGASFAVEKAAAPSEVTLTGEVLDLACYIGQGAKGSEHAACAAKCIEMGQPVGLAASDGKVYVLLADHADSSAFTKVKSMAGKKVEIKGEVAARDGMNALTVHAVKSV